MDERPVLVTGSTGYVGGRLVPRLLEAGHRVRALGRSKRKLMARPWADHPNLELAQGDVMDAESMLAACRGCRAAYYLVHSMNPGTKDFARADRAAALNTAAAASAAGVERIIYLGGIIPPGKISHHLQSRAQVGAILASGDAQVTFLKAAMILGSGSASFEILRYLVERLPVMTTPRWVRSRVQPIAIGNVLDYLAGCLENPATAGQSFDIGGPQVLTYEDLFQLYARLAGLRKRIIIPVPVLSPKLSSYWIHLVTPIHASLARPLAEGLSNTVVCAEDRIRELVPIRLTSPEQVIGDILAGREAQAHETCHTDAGELAPPAWVQPGDAPYAGGDILEEGWAAVCDLPPQRLWPTLAALGGSSGWLHGHGLWWLRGALDKLVGGVGHGRARRHPHELRAGDALGFWRVLEARPPASLVLVAEMRAPGEAVLFWRLEPAGEGTRVKLVGRFLPKGLAGVAYWRLLEPFHAWLYRGLIQALARRSGAQLLSDPAPFTPGPADGCLLPD